MQTFDVGGKSGTARRVRDNGRGYDLGKYNSSFAGMFPVENPQYVLVARLIDPQGTYYGGLVSGEMVNDALQSAIATRNASLAIAGCSTLAEILDEHRNLDARTRDARIARRSRGNSMQYADIGDQRSQPVSRMRANLELHRLGVEETLIAHRVDDLTGGRGSQDIRKIDIGWIDRHDREGHIRLELDVQRDVILVVDRGRTDIPVVRDELLGEERRERRGARGRKRYFALEVAVIGCDRANGVRPRGQARELQSTARLLDEPDCAILLPVRPWGPMGSNRSLTWVALTYDAIGAHFHRL
jgi:hypothetical protein